MHITVGKLKKQPLLICGIFLTIFMAVPFLKSMIFRAQITPIWYDYEIIASYPHDRQAVTQGLLYRDGFLYESTGLYGRSSLRKVQLETGEVLKQLNLESNYFGEGLADWHDTLIQLTWKAETGFIYDLFTFEPVRTFGYSGEGWGLTRFKESLVMSNGSAEIIFLDPETLNEKRRVTVAASGVPLLGLNELEIVEGKIFANIWPTDTIAIIDPLNGKVTGLVDMSEILQPADRLHRVDVLNGIAYDNQNNRLFITGKLWPKLFEIKLIPR